MKQVSLAVMLSLATCIAACQSKTTMDFETYNPPSTLVVPEHIVTKAKFPFIDIHNHQDDMESENLAELTKIMDMLNMAVMVNLSGQNGNKLQQSVNNVKKNFPKRFIVFANVDFNRVGEAGWAEAAAKQLDAGTGVRHFGGFARSYLGAASAAHYGRARPLRRDW